MTDLENHLILPYADDDAGECQEQAELREQRQRKAFRREIDQALRGIAAQDLKGLFDAETRRRNR